MSRLQLLGRYFLFVLGLWLQANNLLAQATTEIKSVRLWRAPDNTRLVFDLSAAANYKMFPLSNPERVVIDIFNANNFKADLSNLSFNETPIKGVRTNKNDKGWRIVLDLTTVTTPKAFALSPNQQYGHRLVLDLYDLEHKQIAQEQKPQHIPSSPELPKVNEQDLEAIIAQITAGSKQNSAVNIDNREPQTKKTNKKAPIQLVSKAEKNRRDIVIAIDAGHGGEDPGAIGPLGQREKNVVLAIAKQMQQELNSYPGFKGVLTRTGDYFIPLEKRAQIARAKNADLFVSVHADAAKNRKAFGASVYAVSQKGASSETAKWLADSENRSNLIGGVANVDPKDKMLSSVVMNLHMRGSMESSLNVGQKVLNKISSVNPLHIKRVEQAGFIVLKNPDLPSILVETGFISNHQESQKLTNKEHQTKIAKAIVAGVVSFFQQNPPPNTFVAWQRDSGNLPRPTEHIVIGGEGLTHIAAKYNVSLAHLRHVNNLQSDVLKVGQVIKIP